MRTTENLAVRFDAVPDDLALTMRARRRKRVNGTLETVEDVARALENNLEGLVVVVATGFAARHVEAPFVQQYQWFGGRRRSAMR